MPAEDALASLAADATPEQRQRVIKRCERGEEFYKLPEELRAQLRRAEVVLASSAGCTHV